MKNSLIIIMAIMVLACSNNSLPKGILTEEEITPVLVDLHLADAIFNQRYALNITRDSYQDDLYLSVLKKYKLDRKKFEASILYYGKYPDKYKPVYDEVLNRLNELSVKSRIRDSIEARKPIAKDTAQIKKPDVKAIVPADSAQTKKSGTEGAAKDTVGVKK